MSNRFLAEASRDLAAPGLLAGIGAKVSPRVVGLWSDYLFGGSSTQDLSSSFGSDFTNSATTLAATQFLARELKSSLESSPPAFPSGSNTVTVAVAPRIGSAMSELDDVTSANVMDFNVIGEIPGNIAGGIGKNQTACPVGSQPSPSDDSRSAGGTADVTRNPDGTMSVETAFSFRVKDTIDLCPGNCGAPIEQIATVPMSRWEATGISGDVPFQVDFSGPAQTFTTTSVLPPVPGKPPGSR